MRRGSRRCWVESTPKLHRVPLNLVFVSRLLVAPSSLKSHAGKKGCRFLPVGADLPHSGTYPFQIRVQVCKQAWLMVCSSEQGMACPSRYVGYVR